MLKGIGASQGYGIGTVYLKKELQAIQRQVTSDAESEIVRLKDAIKQASVDLNNEYLEKVNTLGPAEGEIFKAHLAMLEDPELQKAMFDQVSSQGVVAEFAAQCAIEQFVQMFESIDNAYFKERALDVKDIGTRIIKKLIGAVDEVISGESLIIVAKDLTPSDTAKIDTRVITGLVTAQGGDTSHSAIIARTLGIPAVMGVKNIDMLVQNGMKIICDGFTGDIVLNPDEETIEKYKVKLLAYEEDQKALLKYKNAPSLTKCGKHLEISANIALPEDVEGALAYGADGVGLFRSEFIYMNRATAPTEEEQFIAYKTVLEGMQNRPVVIRTLDAGGDKSIPYLNIPHEMNPFLGYRAIRVCFEEVELFKTQLRALLRASVYGNLKIMFPMISSLEEVRKAQLIVQEVQNELTSKGIGFDPKVEIGIMIEIPAAAVISDILALEVDFFSIGTNDLIQYTNAVDRMNENIKDLYTPYHPAVLRLIHTTIKNGIENNIWVGMCGSVAGNPKLFPILVAMGLTEFSMGPNQILKCRAIASEYTVEALEVHLKHVLKLSTAAEIERYLTEVFG